MGWGGDWSCGKKEHPRFGYARLGGLGGDGGGGALTSQERRGEKNKNKKTKIKKQKQDVSLAVMLLEKAKKQGLSWADNPANIKTMIVRARPGLHFRKIDGPGRARP